MEQQESSLGQELDLLEQIVSEDTYARYNIRTVVRNDILGSLKNGLHDTFLQVCQAIDDYIGKRYFKSKDNRIQAIRHIPTLDIAVEMFIAVTPHDTPTAIQGVAAAIGNQLGYEDVFEGVRTGAELLGACVNTGLHDVIPTVKSETGSLMVQSLVSLDKDTITFVNATKYLPPMIVEPKPWINNINGGYITKNTSVILKGHNFHMKDQALDVLNQLQSIEWALDLHVMGEVEEPKKPIETDKQALAWAELVQSSNTVYTELLARGNKFYEAWKYDFRGRAYMQGYHVNLQSTSYKKASLNFAR